MAAATPGLVASFAILMARRVAYFNQITGPSAWHALVYSLRGWRVVYFEQTRLGRVLMSVFAKLPGRRGVFTPAAYQVGEYKGLYAEISRLSLEMTEAWFRQANNATTQEWFAFSGQPQRTEAYLKKATLMGTRRFVQHLLLFERFTENEAVDSRLVIEGTKTARWQLSEFCRLTGRSPGVQVSPSLPAKLALIVVLYRYYASLCWFVLRRGISRGVTPEQYLLAQAANWPIGRGRGDDFLVDGETILSHDLILYYSSRTIKPQVKLAVEAAERTGFRTVAWDRVSVAWAWIASLQTLTTYLLVPLLQVWRCLWMGRVGEHGCEVARLMLLLRRQMVGWDVFFQRYRIGCIMDNSVVEDQVAVTMSIHNHGGGRGQGSGV